MPRRDLEGNVPLTKESLLERVKRHTPTFLRDKHNEIKIKRQQHFHFTKLVLSTPTLIGMIILLIIIVALYSVFYLGCLWDPVGKLNNVQFAILNLDKGFDFTLNEDPNVPVRLSRLGQNKSTVQVIDQFLFSTDSPASTVLNWQKVNPFMSREQLNDELENGHYWGYLIIPEDFSNSLLLNCKNLTEADKNPKNMTITYVYSQGRQMTVTSMVTNAVKNVVRAMSDSLANALLKEASIVGNLLVTPRFIAQPIHLEIINNHPIPFYGLNFATYVAGIILWISNMILAGVLFKLFEERIDQVAAEYEHPQFTWRTLSSFFVVSAICTMMTALAFFTMVYIMNESSTSFIYTDYNAGQVILFLWLAAFCFFAFSATLAAGLGSEYFSMGASLFLILQLATSSAILDPVVMHSITWVSVGFPFTYLVDGLRCYFFGAQCMYMTRNYLVIGAWLIFFTATCLLLTASRLREFVKSL